MTFDVKTVAEIVRMKASHDDLSEVEARAVAQEIVDLHTCEIEALREQMSGEICVRQSELDDIAEIVGVVKDAPYAAVRDRVAELARAGDQLRMAT